MRSSSTTSMLALLLLGAAGCDCSGDEPDFGGARPPQASPEPEPLPLAVPGPGLAPATRTDLPASVPAITLRLDGLEFTVTNEALVGSWPPAERERLAAQPPAEAPPGWPTIDVSGALPDGDGLSVPALLDALRSAQAVEVARSHTGGPLAVAVRATGQTPWQSLLRGLYAAGMAGFSEPRFVLASGRGEVELRLPYPRQEQVAAAPLLGVLGDRDERGAAIRRALEANPRDVTTRQHVEPEQLPGIEALAGGAAGPSAAPAVPVTYMVRLGREGLVVTRGQERLGPGCQRVAIGAEPSLPMASLSIETLRACLASAGPASQPYMFEAEPELTFSRVAPILETLDDVGSVVIAVAR